MSSWRETTLGEACELYQPKTISATDLVANGEYPVYGANGVIGKYDKFNHAEPQLLITCRGATCGSVNVSLPNSWINGNAMVVRPRDSSIELAYLEQLFRGGLDLTAVITGAAQPQITRQSLAPLKVRFPPLPEQRRIAAILDQADALRANRREALAQLDNLTQSIFIEMFGDPMTNPQNWACLSLGELSAKITDGEHLNPAFSSVGMPMVMAGNVLEDTIDIAGAKKVDAAIGEKFRKKCNPEIGDLLVVSRGATIGRMCAVNVAEIFCLMGSVILIKVKKDKLHTAFVSALLKHPKMRSALYKTSGSSAQQAIYLKDLKNLPFIVPPLDLQLRFSERVEAIYEIRVPQRESLRELDNLFASLQHRAFRGELV